LLIIADIIVYFHYCRYACPFSRHDTPRLRFTAIIFAISYAFFFAIFAIEVDAAFAVDMTERYACRQRFRHYYADVMIFSFRSSAAVIFATPLYDTLLTLSPPLPLFFTPHLRAEPRRQRFAADTIRHYAAITMLIATLLI